MFAMRMWIASLVLLCVAYRIDCEGDADPKIDELIITADSIGVCFNMGEPTTDLTAYNFYELLLQTASGDTIDIKPFDLNKPDGTVPICIECSVEVEDCLTDKDIDILKTTKEIKLLLIIQESDNHEDNSLPAIIVPATTTMPAELPVPQPSSTDIYIIGDSNSDQIIKIDKEIADDNALELNNVLLDLKDCTDYPCYHKDTVDNSNGLEFKLCTQIGVPVCGLTTQGKEINKEDTKTVTTIAYDYNDPPGHSLAFTFTDGIEFEEVINLSTMERCAPSSCEMGDYAVILVHYTDTEEVFQKGNVKDRDLDVFELGASTLVVEVKWKKLESYHFEMSRIDSSLRGRTSEQFHTAHVDCSATTGEYCHAYFTEVSAGSHTITIKEMNEEFTEVKRDNWNKDTTVTKDSVFPEILVDHTATTVTERSLELDVCFKYITNTSAKETYYEFLAVNSKGQWNKTTGEQKKNENHACFHGVELLLADFSKESKFFVVLRDTHNGKPLASGEVIINLPDSVKLQSKDTNESANGSFVWTIVGTSIGVAICLVALVALVYSKL
ncbi:unnamed protein product [Meganyctiphanes norvegica]|uniref:Uncharacterized protein n=1 Tax=Meganyctiphanes norvegica TaxID=48144 RepID=A0AAV2QL68_MEGNR